MKKFYQKTRGFWVVSRLLLIFLFVGVSAYLIYEFDFKSLIVIIPVIVYLWFMIAIFRKEVLDSPVNYNYKYFTGGFSVLYGILMVFTIFSLIGLGEIQTAGFFLVPLWIILFGIGEIVSKEAEKKNII